MSRNQRKSEIEIDQIKKVEKRAQQYVDRPTPKRLRKLTKCIIKYACTVANTSISRQGFDVSYHFPTIMDSGSAQHIARAVKNAVRSHIKLIGIGGHRDITKTGTWGTLMDVLEVVDTPANLISSGKLLENPKWIKFVIEKDPTNPVNQTWYGITKRNEKVVLAYRNADTDLLYYAASGAGHATTFTNTTRRSKLSLPAVKSHRKKNDRQEASRIKGISQSMASPLPPVVASLQKHFGGLRIKTKEIQILKRTTKEQHLLGAQTNPRRIRPTTAEVEEKKKQREQLEFFESLTADSFDLTYEDHEHCKKGYLICDRMSGTMWCFLYREDKELYDILLEFLVNEAARWKILLGKPNLKCVRIKMDGLSVQQSTAMRKALATMGVALNPVPAQHHQSSGFIEVHIRKIKSTALKLWSGLGYKIPTRFFSACFNTACQVCDLLPDQSHPGNKSSFEMRQGVQPTMEYMPRTLFSTVYFKNPDTDHKLGTSDVGIYIGPGRAGSQAMKIWVPRTNKIFERKDPVFDESVSTYPESRLQRMRQGVTVHSIHDKTTLPRTRNDTKLMQKEKRVSSKISKQDGNHWINLKYNIVSQGTKTIAKPFECGCCGKRYVSVHKIKAHANKMFREQNTKHKEWMRKSSGPSAKVQTSPQPPPPPPKRTANVPRTNAKLQGKKSQPKRNDQSEAPTRKRKRKRKKKSSSKTVPLSNRRITRSQIKKTRNGHSFATFRALMNGETNGSKHRNIPDVNKRVLVQWSVLGETGGVEQRAGTVTRSGRIWYNVTYNDGTVVVHDRDNVWAYESPRSSSLVSMQQVKKRQRKTNMPPKETPYTEHSWTSDDRRQRVALPTMEDSIPSNIPLRESNLSSDLPPVAQTQRRSYLATTSSHDQKILDAQSLAKRKTSSRYEQPVAALSSKRHRGLQQSLYPKQRTLYVQSKWPQGDDDMYQREAWFSNAAVTRDLSQPSHAERNTWLEEEEFNKIQQLYDDIQFKHDPAPQLVPGSPDVSIRSLYAEWFEEQPVATRATLPTPQAEDPNAVQERVQHYHGPEGCEESATEVHGYHANLNQTEYHPIHGYVILTPENASREEPNTMKAARQSKHWNHGLKEAVEAEIDCMNKYQVFTRDRLPAGRKCIGVRWVFKAKFENGIFVKWKARMCAQGFSLLPGLEYRLGETSSPVARSHTYMAALAEAAQMGYKLKFFDVKSAYLLSPLNERLYMKIPEGVEMGLDNVTGTNCLRICRSIYGLPQSGRNHYVRFTGQLLELGFEQSKNDPCLFTLRKDGEILRLVLWVDDAVITTSSEELWLFVRDAIHSLSPLGKMGDLEWVLGMQVEQDLEAGTISLNQTSKINMIIERYGSPNAKAKATPLPPKWTSKKRWMPQTPEEIKETVEGARKAGLHQCRNYTDFIHEYRSLLGALAHIALWGRLDLKASVFLLARYQANPGINHWKGLRHILLYLVGTKDLKLIFGSRRPSDGSVVTAQVDSDYCGNNEDVKSTTGYVIWMYGSVIYAESRKQRATTLSTTEAELVAASDCARMLRYIRRLLVEDFHIDLPPIPLGEDNQGCIHLSHDGGNWKRKRHIRVANSYLYEEVTINKTIAIKYVRSDDNCADMMTKCLPAPLFIKHRATLMGHV